MYDTKERAYVALDEIARWIDAGEQVCVRDAKSSEDVTIAVLLPLLVHRMSRHLVGAVGVRTLHELIRWGVPALHGDVPPDDKVRLDALERRVAALESR